MQYSLSALTRTVSCAILLFGAAALAQAADPTGTWTWSVPGRGGGEPRQTTLKLKAEGDKLTGTISSPGRQGAQGRETAIEDGKITGNDISFKVTREVNGNKFTQTYKGTVNGDTIKGKVEFERQGQTQSRDWLAKRGGEKK